MRKELSRGGQVYYLHNRVETIDLTASRIQKLLGPEVRGLDGFYGEDIPAYADLGIRIPAEPDLLCDQVYEKTGVQSYIVDANGLGVELMGKSSGITAPETWLTEVIRDNPAGQEEQMTPFILVRRLRDAG